MGTAAVVLVEGCTSDLGDPLKSSTRGATAPPPNSSLRQSASVVIAVAAAWEELHQKQSTIRLVAGPSLAGHGIWLLR